MTENMFHCKLSNICKREDAGSSRKWDESYVRDAVIYHGVRGLVKECCHNKIPQYVVAEVAEGFAEAFGNPFQLSSWKGFYREYGVGYNS